MTEFDNLCAIMVGIFAVIIFLQIAHRRGV